MIGRLETNLRELLLGSVQLALQDPEKIGQYAPHRIFVLYLFFLQSWISKLWSVFC